MSPRVTKILRNILFLLSVPLIISAFVFARVGQKGKVCKGLDIAIQNPEVSFITKKDVVGMIEAQGIMADETLVDEINLQDIEKTFADNKWIKSSNAFMGSDQVLHLHIEQKEPKVRIVEKDSTDYAYYLDEYANPIPLSSQYSPRLPIVTTSEIGFSRSELSLKSDLVTLASYIQKDTFWNAAISQIDIDDKGQIVLIPVLGTQTILFGNIEDMANKFDRLLLFYKHSVHRVDWTKYDELDVRFSGQVICRNHRGEILAIDPYNKQQQQKPSSDKTIPPKANSVKPVASKLEVKKPEIKRPDTRKPESKKVEPKKTEAKKMEVKKTDAKKPAAKKPETKKPLNP